MSRLRTKQRRARRLRRTVYRRPAAHPWMAVILITPAAIEAAIAERVKRGNGLIRAVWVQ